MKQYLLFSTCLLVGLASCAKKEAAFPANTLQMKVKGQQVTFPVSGVTAVFNQRYKEFDLTATAPDAAKTSLQFKVVANNRTFEVPATYATGKPGASTVESVYGYLVLTAFQNYCGQTIYPNDYITYHTYTITPVCTFTIETIDTDRQVFSGTFSGAYWKGCDKLEITNGQFNLPYTVKP
jgi:hypothetical protein